MIVGMIQSLRTRRVAMAALISTVIIPFRVLSDRGKSDFLTLLNKFSEKFIDDLHFDT